MNELALKTYVVLSLLPRRAMDRLRDDETGQTAAEYIGLIVVIGIILGTIAASGIGTVITTEVKEAIQGVMSDAGKASS